MSYKCIFCKSERHHTCCQAVNRFYCSGLLAGVGGDCRAADVPGYRDLSLPPPAQPEALVYCSCLMGEKSWKPQIRITTNQ